MEIFLLVQNTVRNIGINVEDDPNTFFGNMLEDHNITVDSTYYASLLCKFEVDVRHIEEKCFIIQG